MNYSKALWAQRHEDILPPCAIYTDLLYAYKMRTGKTLEESRSTVGNWTFADWHKNGYIIKEQNHEKETDGQAGTGNYP